MDFFNSKKRLQKKVLTALHMEVTDAGVEVIIQKGIRNGVQLFQGKAVITHGPHITFAHQLHELLHAWLLSLGMPTNEEVEAHLPIPHRMVKKYTFQLLNDLHHQLFFGRYKALLHEAGQEDHDLQDFLENGHLYVAYKDQYHKACTVLQQEQEGLQCLPLFGEVYAAIVYDRMFELGQLRGDLLKTSIPALFEATEVLFQLDVTRPQEWKPQIFKYLAQLNDILGLGA